MLAIELKKLKELSGLLAPGRQGLMLPGTPADFERAVEDEITRVCDALTDAMFSPFDDKLLERFVQHHQTAAIRLADELHSWLQEEIPDPESGTARERLSRHFISQLFRLLDYFELYFSKYFNMDSKLPEPYGALAFQEMAGKLDYLSGLLAGVKDEALAGCLSAYLDPFLAERRYPEITYRELIYLKTLVGEITQLLEKAGQDAAADIIAALYYLNFNHLGFFSYCQQRFRTEAAVAASGKEYAGMVMGAITATHSIQTKPGFYFHEEWPPITEMMETWLRDELESATMKLRPFHPSANLDTVTEEDKMELQLSVSQIACLTRLFYDEGLYPGASVTDLLRFIAKHYRSKRQQQISNGSLAKEYYGISQVTAAVVRDLLTRMVMRINKLYFPVWAAACAAYCYF